MVVRNASGAFHRRPALCVAPPGLLPAQRPQQRRRRRCRRPPCTRAAMAKVRPSRAGHAHLPHALGRLDFIPPRNDGLAAYRRQFGAIWRVLARFAFQGFSSIIPLPVSPMLCACSTHLRNFLPRLASAQAPTPLLTTHTCAAAAAAATVAAAAGATRGRAVADRGGRKGRSFESKRNVYSSSNSRPYIRAPRPQRRTHPEQPHRRQRGPRAWCWRAARGGTGGRSNCKHHPPSSWTPRLL